MNKDYLDETHSQECQLRYMTEKEAEIKDYGCTCPNDWKEKKCQ